GANIIRAKPRVFSVAINLTSPFRRQHQAPDRLSTLPWMEPQIFSSLLWIFRRGRRRAAPRREEAPRFHGCPERIPGSLSLGRRLLT
ncbi:hypothetical protein GB928_010590, partial [Shinella curvata]